MHHVNSFTRNSIVRDLDAVISAIIRGPLYNIVENDLDSSDAKLAANLYNVDDLLNPLTKTFLHGVVGLLFYAIFMFKCLFQHNFGEYCRNPDFVGIISCVLKQHNRLSIFKSSNLKEVPYYILVYCATLVSKIINFMGR
jgi:hypothetical protein